MKINIKIAQIIFLAIIVSMPQIIFAQQDKVKEKIELVMYSAKRKKMINADKLIFEKENIKFTLNEISKYTKDSLFYVRNKAYIIIKKVGHVSKNNEEVTKVVNFLANACLDKNSGIVRFCAKSLKIFPRNVFSDTAKINIGKSLQANPKAVSYIAPIIGYLNLKEHINVLQNYANNSNLRKKDRWYAHLALARMGEQSSISFLLNTYKQQNLSSEIVQHMVPNFLYTRNRELYDEIIKILYVDKKSCTSSNPYNEKSILCGYLVMEQLAPYIKDFPLETRASGSIKSNDYDKSLNELKKWFTKNKDYTIIDNKF